MEYQLGETSIGIPWIIALLISTLLFIASGGWLAGVNVLQRKRWHWVLISAACLFLAILTARWAYFAYKNLLSTAAIDQWSIVLFLLAAGSALGGVVLLSKLSVQEQFNLQAAQEELARYKIHFEQDPRLLLIKDHQGRYLAANPACTTFLGKDNQAIIGENDITFFTDATANALRQFDEKTLANKAGAPQEIELTGVRGPGWFQITRTPLFDQSGNSLGLLLAARDLSNERMHQAKHEAWQSGVQILLDLWLDLFKSDHHGEPFGRLVAWAQRLAECEHVGLWSFSSEGAEAVLVQATGRLESLAGKKLKAGEDIPWKVWKSGQAFYIKDYSKWGNGNAALKQTGLQSGIGVPLKSANQVIYVLTMYYDSLSPALVEPRTGLLELLAQIAIESLNLQQRLVDLNNTLSNQEQKEKTLNVQTSFEHAIANQAIQFINLEENKFEEAIRLALKTLARQAGVDRAFLAILPEGMHTRIEDVDLFSANSNSYTCALSYGKGEALLQPDFRWALEKLNNLEIVYIADSNNLAAEELEAQTFLVKHNLASIAAAPLIGNRQMRGILGMESFQSATEWRHELLETLSTAADLFMNLLDRRKTLQGERLLQQEYQRQIAQLEQRTHEYTLLGEMSDLLLACRTADEAYPVIHHYLQDMLPEKSGALYLFDEENELAEKAVAWGIAAPPVGETELTTNDCWGLRRGRLYLVKDPQAEPLCGHIKELIQNAYLCVPMLAQGRAIGLMHLRTNGGNGKANVFEEDEQHLARRSAEYIAMSLINLRLRDELRSQAIRDPLTGLFNRRYMEETLDREIRRAQRHKTTVSVIMFDIDRMKPINDKLGHDAGDLLLKSLGATLLSMFRGEDVACRFGGDEFTIVLPEASLANTWRRAEQVRKAVRSLNLSHEGRSFGTVTLSIGLAAYPEHGLSADRILQAADAALYVAKSEGGDRITMGKGSDKG